MVISAIYAGLINATLDPYNQLVVVSSVSPLRDLQPNSIPAMLKTLAAWEVRCGDNLSELEKQIERVKKEAARRAREEAEWKKEVEKLVDVKGADSQEGKSGGGGFLGGLGRRLGVQKRVPESDSGENSGEEMDIDEESGKGGKNLKRSFGMTSGK